MNVRMRFAGVVTGSELFRVASLCLYVTLLLHAALASYVRNTPLSAEGVIGFGTLVALCCLALGRYVWSSSNTGGTMRLMTELFFAVLVVVGMTLQNRSQGLPLPWLIGLAGVFPLALKRTPALIATIGITILGLLLNITLASEMVGWLPHMFATLFVGLSASFLSTALNSNYAAVQQAELNQRRFDAIARATRHVFLIADAQYRIKYVNQALEDIIGYSYEEIVRYNLRAVLHPDDKQEHERKLRYLRSTPKSSIFSRHRTKHRRGHWVWMETRGYNMLHDQAINGLVFSIEDISARKDAERQLQEEHALLRAVLDLNPAMIYATDKEGRFTFGNQTFQRHFGFPSEDVLRGKSIVEIFTADVGGVKHRITPQTAERLLQQDLRVIRTGTPLEDQEVQGLWNDDRRFWYRVSKYPLSDAEAQTIGMLCIARDVTDHKEYEMRLEHQALHDSLTGLPNRRYLLKTIADAITQTGQTLRPSVMLFCDLDFFKSVNDTHGHDFGDKCLMEITRRILASLPTQDFVARFGGNEFVVLSNATIAEAKLKAETLLQAVSDQLMIDQTVVKIHTSIGIAALNPQHKSPSEWLREADAAMYQAKERGRNRFEIFDASLQANVTKRAQLDVALRFALERNELTPVYQPKVSMLDGAVKGFELLLRWNNPQYGEVSPTEFIPVAENSGLVVPIGLWVLEEACKQIRAWRAAYPDMGDFTIAVNVSMRQLLQSSFLDEVTDIMERTGVEPSAIELELTETSAMANPVQTAETLTLLKKRGFRLALDDFGTGYSSLAYLQKLPIDVLKIDRGFVQGLDRNPGDAEIVRLILALAQTLNLDTVAEGVETREDMIRLKKMGCYLAQGYAFSPALAADGAADLLRKAKHFDVS